MSQIKVPKGIWVKISEDECDCQAKVFRPTYVFYVEQDEDPNKTLPNPTVEDDVLLIAGPRDMGSRIEVKYQNSKGALWVYSTAADILIAFK